PRSNFCSPILHHTAPPGRKTWGREGKVPPCHYHRVALWALAQSRLLERASPRELVGAGSRSHLARPGERHPISLWRWQPRRQTRHQEPCNAERADKQASSLVFWSALRPAVGGMGGLCHSSGLSAYSAQAPRRLSQ